MPIYSCLDKQQYNAVLKQNFEIIYTNYGKAN